MNPTNNYNENLPDVVNILVEFLEVAIHQLLYLRQLYPQSIFVLKKMYGVPVQISRHPDVNSYITNSLQSVRELAQKSQLSSLTVYFFNEQKQPIERFIFDILELQKSKLSDSYSDSYLLQLEESLRAFCLRLAATDLKPLQNGNSFQIHVRTTEQGSVALSNDPKYQTFPWIAVGQEEFDLSAPQLVPIRTIRTSFLTLQTYLETMS